MKSHVGQDFTKIKLVSSFVFVTLVLLVVFAVSNNASAQNSEPVQDKASVANVQNSENLDSAQSDVAKEPAQKDAKDSQGQQIKNNDNLAPESQELTPSDAEQATSNNITSDTKEPKDTETKSLAKPAYINVNLSFVGGTGVIKQYTDNGFEDLNLSTPITLTNEHDWDIELTNENIFTCYEPEVGLGSNEEIDKREFFVVPDLKYKIVTVKLNGDVISIGDVVPLTGDCSLSFELGTIDKYTISGKVLDGLQEGEPAIPNFSFGYYTSDGKLIGNYTTDEKGEFSITVYSSEYACGYIYKKQANGYADLLYQISFSTWINNSLISETYSPGVLKLLSSVYVYSKKADVCFQDSNNHKCFNIKSKINMGLFVVPETSNYKLENISLSFDIFGLLVFSGGDLIPTEFRILEDGSLSFSGGIPEMLNYSFDQLITPVPEEGYVFDYWYINGKQYRAGDRFKVESQDSLALNAADGLDSYDKLDGYVSYKPATTSSSDQSSVDTSTYSSAQTGDSNTYVYMLIVVAILSACVTALYLKRNKA